MKKIDFNRDMKEEIATFNGEKRSLLLHSCCAPCSSHVLEQLTQYFDITILFYNPNIHPKKEYLLRLEELKVFYKQFLPDAKIEVVEGSYNPQDFFTATEKLKEIKEGGERCFECYKLRMKEAANYAKKCGIDYFTTALSISPHKNSREINRIGFELEKEFEVKYLTADFKKEGGFKRSTEISKEYNLYRQDYCGCIYSKQERGIMEKVLVTGGTGYIGSHTVIQLIEKGYEVVILDNLSNSKIEALNRVEKITGIRPQFHEVDLLDYDKVDEIFKNNRFEFVIHFAGLKAVGESVQIPLNYYHSNITGSLNLFKIMQKHEVFNLLFSSSATVYGDPHTVPIKEDFPITATNPYGRTKLFIEEILRDLFISDSRFNIVLLRYFNPVGAHKSGLIGEDPNGIPNNLMPFITQVAIGKLEKLKVFGNDYDTHDGTGVRDYIHVVDLARGHLKSLDIMDNLDSVKVFNLGTGKGYSVLDVVKAFEKGSSKEIPYEVTERRSGDIGSCYADPELAKTALNWEAEFGIDEMCEDAWRWQSMNPNGLE